MKFRHEYKHYITEFSIAGLRRRLGVFAEQDRNAGDDGSYRVNSLYFDNCYDKVLMEKICGLEKREKFRIRYYNHDLGFIRLEKKSKISGLCLKQSARLSAEQVWAIMTGNIEWMRTAEGMERAPEEERNLVMELWAKMQYQLLRPKSVVVYEREAFVYRPGNVRVTIDKNIRGVNDIYLFMEDNPADLRLFHSNILEVKWDEYLPQIVRDAVQMENIKTSSFSKYAATRFAAF